MRNEELTCVWRGLKSCHQSRHGRWRTDRKDFVDGQICWRKLWRGLYPNFGLVQLPRIYSLTSNTDSFFRCQFYGEDNIHTEHGDYLFDMGSRRSTRIRQHVTPSVQWRRRYSVHVWFNTKKHLEQHQGMVQTRPRIQQDGDTIPNRHQIRSLYQLVERRSRGDLEAGQAVRKSHEGFSNLQQYFAFNQRTEGLFSNWLNLSLRYHLTNNVFCVLDLQDCTCQGFRSKMHDTRDTSNGRAHPPIYQRGLIPPSLHDHADTHTYHKTHKMRSLLAAFWYTHKYFIRSSWRPILLIQASRRPTFPNPSLLYSILLFSLLFSGQISTVLSWCSKVASLVSYDRSF